MENIQVLLQYTIEILKQGSIKYELNQFPSGASMLDIWYNDKFYIIQFEDFIGFSEVNSENSGFDTNPDEKFFEESKYKEKLMLVFK